MAENNQYVDEVSVALQAAAGFLGAGGAQPPGTARPVVDSGMMGQGAVGSVLTYIVNQLLGQFKPQSPWAASVENQQNLLRGQNAEMFADAAEGVLTEKIGDLGAPVAKFLGFLMKTQGASPEFMQTISQTGLDRDPAFQKMAIGYGAQGMGEKLHGRFAGFYQQDTDRARRSLEDFAEYQKAHGNQFGVGDMSVLQQTAVDFNLSSRYAKSNFGDTSELLKKLDTGKSLTGLNTRQTFDIMSDLYDSMIGEQIPNIEKFYEKMYTLSQKGVSLQQHVAYSRAIRSNLKQIGIDSPALAEKMSYQFLASERDILNEVNSNFIESGENEGELVAKGFHYNVVQGRIQEGRVRMLQSDSARITGTLMDLMDADTVEEFQEKIRKAGPGGELTKALLENGGIVPSDVAARVVNFGLESADADALGLQGVTPERLVELVRQPLNSRTAKTVDDLYSPAKTFERTLFNRKSMNDEVRLEIFNAMQLPTAEARKNRIVELQTRTEPEFRAERDLLDQAFVIAASEEYIPAAERDAKNVASIIQPEYSDLSLDQISNEPERQRALSQATSAALLIDRYLSGKGKLEGKYGVGAAKELARLGVTSGDHTSALLERVLLNNGVTPASDSPEDIIKAIRDATPDQQQRISKGLRETAAGLTPADPSTENGLGTIAVTIEGFLRDILEALRVLDKDEKQPDAEVVSMRELIPSDRSIA